LSSQRVQLVRAVEPEDGDCSVALDLDNRFGHAATLTAGTLTAGRQPRDVSRTSPHRKAGTLPALAAAAVGPREDLQDVPAGSDEIAPATAVPGVDLAGTILGRVGPEVHAPLGDPAEHLVELRLADQERVVLGGNLLVRAHEVHAQVVRQL